MFDVNLLQDKLKENHSDVKSIPNYFNEVANLLMNNCVISKGDIRYEIVEIEFYLCSKFHPDVITYPRKLKAGQWFFHQSGVDLTFESTSKDQFGGILIRGINRLTPRAEGDNRPLLILGPQKCVDELWGTFDAFGVDASDYPVIVPGEVTHDEKIKTYPRWIPLGKKTITKEDEDDAKRLKVEATITKFLKCINGNSELQGIYEKSIDSKVVSDFMFNRPYRYIKESSIVSESSEWKKYSSKPK